MRTYKYLMAEYLSEDNYRLAVKNATKHKGGKKKKFRIAQAYRDNADALCEVMTRLACNFENDPHKPKKIYDGVRRKERTIYVPSMREQIVHHMVINVLKPIFMKGMYEHSYGSIPDRGAHLAKKRIEKWIRNGGKDVKYCLKMDIKKYFESVPHDILKKKLAKIIKDSAFLKVLYEIVDAVPDGKGMPIGFYTSQWFANWYLTELDHYIKQELGAKYYVRYMDDMVIFGGNKRKLHQMRLKIAEYLCDNLGLELKDNWQVFLFDYVKEDGTRVGRDLDFMGFRFFRNKTILRKKLMYKATRKARRIAKKPRKTVHDCRQMLSYLGWIDCTDTYDMYKKWIKPFVNFQNMKRLVSFYQRRINNDVAKSLLGNGRAA